MKWHGLIKILEITHLSKDKEILWSATNLRNMMHLEGEAFILNSLFVGGNVNNLYIPEYYYFGLDARASLAEDDGMADVESSEPSTNGYERQDISSTDQFTVSLASGVYRAISPIITFSASGGPWGTVKNLFLTNKNDYSGSLIASVPLTQTISVASGESINMRMGLSLKDCP